MTSLKLPSPTQQRPSVSPMSLRWLCWSARTGSTGEGFLQVSAPKDPGCHPPVCACSSAATHNHETAAVEKTSNHFISAGRRPSATPDDPVSESSGYYWSNSALPMPPGRWAPSGPKPWTNFFPGGCRPRTRRGPIGPVSSRASCLNTDGCRRPGRKTGCTVAPHATGTPEYGGLPQRPGRVAT